MSLVVFFLFFVFFVLVALCQLFLLRIFFFLTSKTAKFLTAKMVPSVSFLFCTVVTYDNYWSVASGIHCDASYTLRFWAIYQVSTD